MRRNEGKLRSAKNECGTKGHVQGRDGLATESAADVIERLVVFERREFFQFSGGVDGCEDLFLSAGGELAAFAGFLHDFVRQAIGSSCRHYFVIIDATGFEQSIERLDTHEHIFGIGLGGFFGFGSHGSRMEQKVTKDRKA